MLQDPVVVYEARTNNEAHMFKMVLVEAGIEAFVSEDFSTVGLWALGTLPMIHKPQIFVSRADHERARTIIENLEDQTFERIQAREQVVNDNQEPIEVVCDECQHKSFFPAEERGTIQNCPRCRAYVDVGEIDDQDIPWQEGDEPGAE